MKILYISSEYPPETGFGGIGTYTRCIAEGMADRGHEIHVIAGSAFNSHHTQCENNVMIHRIPSENYPLPHNKFFYPLRKICYKYIPHSLVRLAWAKAVKFEYFRLLQKLHRFDIVEYPECGAEGYYLDAQTKRVARLHTPWHLIHSLDKINEPVPDQFLLDHIEKMPVKKAQIVTSPSSALASHIQKKWNVNNIKVIPNPIPSTQYNLTTGGGWIYTGRIEMRKGVHLLIEAYASIPTSSPPPPLTLIGKAYGKMNDGNSYENYIQSLIRKYNLKSNIRIIPGVPYNDIKKHLQTSSVAFFPSLWENFPYTCLEAMACGLAVVTSDTGGYPEMVVNGESGILVKTNNAVTLQQAMNHLLQNPNRIPELGFNARKRIQNLFDSAKICESMEKIYQNER